MSKHPRRVIRRKPATQRSYAGFASDARADVEVTRELLQQFAANEFTHLPHEICAFLDCYAESCVDDYWPKRVRRDALLTRKQVAAMIRRAVHDGYRWAVMDYSEDLEISDAKKVDDDEREQAGVRGRATQVSRKQSRQQQAKQMQNDGQDELTIAAHFGVHPSTVYRWLKPSAPLSLQRAKRDLKG